VVAGSPGTFADSVAEAVAEQAIRSIRAEYIDGGDVVTNDHAFTIVDHAELWRIARLGANRDSIGIAVL